MVSNKTFKNEEYLYNKTPKKSVRELKKWVKGVMVTCATLGVVLIGSKMVNAIQVDNYADQLSNIDEVAQVYHREQGNYIIGNDSEKMDEIALKTIEQVSQGSNVHVLIASHYHEADRAHGYDDEIPAMDEFFRSLHSRLYGHEDEYPEELRKILEITDFTGYLEFINSTPKEYHHVVSELLAIAQKYGSDSEEVNEFLISNGFTYGSGGRK